MPTQRIVIADAQVPFVEGGAELHVRALLDQLVARGHEAEIVKVPFNPQAKSELLSQSCAWRMLNLSEVGGRRIDLLIATRFPSYCARHPHKVVWLIHQHRAAYELCGTPYSDFHHTEMDVGIRRTLIELDTRMFRECERIFTNAANTAARLEKFNGVTGTPLYHPPPLAERLRPGSYDDYLLVVGRLEAIKRPELAIRAMTGIPAPMRLVFVGEGSHRAAAEAVASAAGVGDRVTFAGRATPEELTRLYADALAVVYAPFDEDYGYVTLEAFLARKPVITATDSGGTLEFVVDGVNGFVCGPEPRALAEAVNRLMENRSLAPTLGRAGYDRAKTITWDGVIDSLLGAAH